MDQSPGHLLEICSQLRHHDVIVVIHMVKTSLTSMTSLIVVQSHTLVDRMIEPKPIPTEDGQ